MSERVKIVNTQLNLFLHTIKSSTDEYENIHAMQNNKYGKYFKMKTQKLIRVNQKLINKVSLLIKKITIEKVTN